MRIYTILSRLIDYPTEELFAHLDEIGVLASSDEHLSEKDRTDMSGFISWMTDSGLMAAQQHYVATFDHRPENSLHLTHHLFGEEDRGRGPAMIKISEHYKNAGLEPKKGELPDFLPLLLEYASTLEPSRASSFIGDAHEALEILAENLENDATPYAALIRVLVRHGEPYKKAA